MFALESHQGGFGFPTKQAIRAKPETFLVQFVLKLLDCIPQIR
jgi:hypothetical protein